MRVDERPFWTKSGDSMTVGDIAVPPFGGGKSGESTIIEGIVATHGGGG